MTFTAEAIDKIQSSTVAQVLTENIQTDSPVAFVPNTFSVKSLEEFMAFRSDYRGNFNTRSIKAFGQYCEKHDSEDTFCYVDPEKMSAIVIFDQFIAGEAAPGHCKHTASIKLKKTPDFEALLGLNGSRTGQKALAEWLEDWRDQTFPYGEANEDGDQPSMAISKAIASVRRTKITASSEADHSQGDFSASSSRMDSVSASSAEGNVAGFLFTCTPYEGLDEHTFDVRLSLLTSEEKPVWIPRIRVLAKRELEIAEDFSRKLDEELQVTSIETFLGTFSNYA